MNARLRLILFCSSAIAAACGAPPVPTGETFTVGDALDARAAFDSLYASMRRRDASATLAFYDTSLAFAHAIDGDLIRGRAAFDGLVRSTFPTIRAFEDAAIDSVFIIPAGKDAAMLVAAFHETVVDSTGKRDVRRGIWSNLFVRRAAGWRVIFGQTAHVAMSAPRE
jgi:hypothetical protein